VRRYSLASCLHQACTRDMSPQPDMNPLQNSSSSLGARTCQHRSRLHCLVQRREVNSTFVPALRSTKSCPLFRKVSLQDRLGVDRQRSCTCLAVYVYSQPPCRFASGVFSSRFALASPWTADANAASVHRVLMIVRAIVKVDVENEDLQEAFTRRVHPHIILRSPIRSPRPFAQARHINTRLQLRVSWESFPVPNPIIANVEDLAPSNLRILAFRPFTGRVSRIWTLLSCGAERSMKATSR
jgi:hypothetical protein